MEPVLQDHLPNAPWLSEATRRLPGVQPLRDPAQWLVRDGAFAGQMALRDDLLATRRADVIATTPGCDAALAEMYETVLGALAGQDDGYGWGAGTCTRPDGVAVPLDARDPLGTLARLVQQDLCVLEQPEGAPAHVLTSAALCFPASWTLSQKIGRPLTAIHGPVDSYDDTMARRVQRLFDHLRADMALWRQNAMIYRSPDLYHPRREDDPRDDSGDDPGADHWEGPGAGAYLRSEKQVLRRLPRTGAVVFSIHTYVLRLEDLTPEQRAGLSHIAQGS